MTLFKFKRGKGSRLIDDAQLISLVQKLRFGNEDNSSSAFPMLNIRSISRLTGVSDSTIAKIIGMTVNGKSVRAENKITGLKKLSAHHISYLVNDSTLKN
jgi:hypothetical protein